jgi:putative mycofactocin binding protein MftB
MSESTHGFDTRARWRLHPSVAVRPEPFGALLYHFGTRRLTFVKDRRLLRIVQSLGDAPSVEAACQAAGVAPAEQARFTAALGRLADTDMLVPAVAAEASR